MGLKFYISLGVLVNCIWGTAFLIPYVLPEVSSVFIALGRYFSYGLLSLGIIVFGRKHWQGLTKKQWWYAFVFSFTGNFGYYLLMASSVQIGSIVTTSLIIGILPVALLVVGNMIEPSIEFRRLVFPIVLILLGMLVLANGHGKGDGLQGQLALGAILAFMALAMWTYFGVANARFLKQNDGINSNTWALAIGVGCLVQSIMVLPFVFTLTDWHHDFNALSVKSVGVFLLLSVFLGVVVSWWAALLWNRASRNLPIALCGQLLVFETLSSLFYGYLADWRFPSLYESVAIALVISGVFIVLRNKW
ncbi:DMT family transporter [Marinomonas epiphytica]